MLSDLGVDLRCPDAFVPKELADGFDRYVIFQGYRGGEGMTCRMSG